MYSRVRKAARRGKKRRRDGEIIGNAGRPQIASTFESKIDRHMVNRVPLFPVSRRVTAQRYYDRTHIFTPAAGTVSAYVYSANGMFDPDISGTGHQPMGFDQMMLFYEQATVIRSRIKVSFGNLLTTCVARCALYVNPDTSSLSSAADIVENGQLESKLVGFGSGQDSVLELSLELDIQKYFGRTGDIVNDSDLASTTAANPVEQVYFILAAWDAFGTTTLSVGFDAIIEYDVVYHEPRKVAGS